MPHDQIPQLLEAQFVKRLSVGQQARFGALVTRIASATDRRGRTYLALSLRGADGIAIAARWWDCTLPSEQWPMRGRVYFCITTLDMYQGEQQFRIQRMDPAPEIPLLHFVRTTRRSLGELQTALAVLIGALRPPLKALVETVFSEEVYRRFCEYPAAHAKHGAVRHGLLAHSVHVAHIAQMLATVYGSDGLPSDEDLIITAALLHDVGKIHTLPPIAGMAAPERASYFDHVSLGVMMVRTAAEHATPCLPVEDREALLHAILAHHGHVAWGAPITPQTVEACVVHLADYVESRLWAWSKEEGNEACDSITSDKDRPGTQLADSTSSLCSTTSPAMLGEQTLITRKAGMPLHDQ